MRLEKMWEGKLPSYWDITTWVTLAEHYLVVCYREPDTRRRLLEVFDLFRGISSKEESVYNVILGTIGTTVFPALITDARSHLQIRRMARYDIVTRSSEWSLSEYFLVEKFKIPSMSHSSAESYFLGNKRINLFSGDVSSDAQFLRQQGWEIDKDLRLEQRDKYLVCVNSRQETLWSINGYFGSWYQGIQGERLFFLLPDCHLTVIDKKSGEVLVRFFLKDIKSIAGRINGSFDYKNESSFDNCTIADLLIYNDLVVWVTERNQLATCNLRTGKLYISNEAIGEYDVCLASINSHYILFYDIRDVDYGSLLLGRVEDFKNEANFGERG